MLKYYTILLCKLTNSASTNSKVTENVLLILISHDDDRECVTHINLMAVVARHNRLIKLIITSEINEDLTESLPIFSPNINCCDELIRTSVRDNKLAKKSFPINYPK